MVTVHDLLTAMRCGGSVLDDYLLGADLTGLQSGDLELLGVAKKKETTQIEREAGVAKRAFGQYAERQYMELLTVAEERYLSHAMPLLKEHAQQLGIIDLPLGKWPKAARLQFFAMVVRSAVPLMGAADCESYRRFNDEIPFGHKEGEPI